VRLHLALDHPEMAVAVSGKIQNGVNRKRQHRAFDEIA